MNLPEAFTTRMQQQLGEEYEAFLESFSNDRFQGLRVNTLKISKEAFLTQNPFSLEPVPWCDNGFYYQQEERPGRHVWHEAGLYYIQEPSAMSAAGLLGAQPGECVLDLCAAPGGKTGQIAAAMQGEGILVANEIIPSRAKILSRNLERLGVRNALVVNESPASLAKHMPERFDRILCDAPCSGEGMFRKDENAIAEWSPEHVKMCADRQLFEVLMEAEKMLKPGGRLVYSTCTFADAENEEVITRFLEACPSMEVDPEAACPYFTPGKVPGVWRLWPHKLHGEGHGVAVLRKKGSSPSTREELAMGYYPVEKTISLKDKKKLKDFPALVGKLVKEPWQEGYYFFGEQLYLLPEGCPPLMGLKVVRPGLQIGELKGKVLKPAHALAMALRPEEVPVSVNLSKEAAKRYLQGEAIADCTGKGWALACVDGISMGWGKITNGLMKNHYPKGLRITWN